MKHSDKKTEPTSFTHYKDKRVGKKHGRKLSYGHFKKQGPKKELTVHIMDEQKNLCCYCGRRISGENKSHLEHFFSQKHFKKLALDYSNMFISCGLTGTGYTPETCGFHKKELEIDANLIPSNRNCEGNFIYGSDGTITGLNPEAKAAIKILNLGEATLASDRKVVISGLEGMIASGEISKTNWQTELPKLCAASDGSEPGYVQVIRRYIEAEFS